MNTGFRFQEKAVYRLVYAGNLICILLFGAGEYLGIGKLGILHFLAAFGVLALTACIQLLTGKGRILCLASVTIFALVTGVAAGLENCLSFFHSYWRWLIGSPLWIEEWETGYELLQVALIVLFCYFLGLIFEKYFFLKVGMTYFLICILLFCLLTETPLSHAGVVFALGYIVSVCVEWIQFYWDKSRGRDRKAHMLWIMPFLAAYVAVMLFLPAREEPYDWQFAKTAFSHIKESFISMTQNRKWGGKENFDMALSGFNEDGALQGDIQENEREIMVIQGSGNRVSNVYLIGRIYDTFDGRQWYQENNNTTPERFLDAGETLYAVKQFDEKYPRDYLYRSTLRIRYRYFNTAYLFAPLKTESIQCDDGKFSYVWNGGSLLFADKEGKRETKRGYGTEYEVTYFQMNAGTEEFDRFLAAEQTDTPDGTTDAHRQEIYDTYLDGVALSEEVEDYLHNITMYAADDVEKLRMIEASLASFTYTESPAGLPDNVTDAGEYLDYFLLESREGYCTYFATAFTLMARAEGIPARYVQGFLVPVAGNKETTVYGSMAHSWPEAYIEGVGWIPFEPTPGYGGMRYTTWETEQSGRDAAFDADRGDYQSDFTGISGDASSGNASETDLTVHKPPGYIRKIIGIVFSTAMLVLAVCFLFLVLERTVRKYRYQRMDFTERFLVAVSDNLRILSWFGLRRGDNETLQEFKKRTETLLGLSGKPLLFLEEYEKLLYGEKMIDGETIGEVRREGEFLLALLKEKKKRMYVFYWVRTVWR